jgi:hypothetical protein
MYLDIDIKDMSAIVCGSNESTKSWNFEKGHYVGKDISLGF